MKYPNEQFWHFVEPVTSLYCPGSHAEQLPPFAPVNPLKHVQKLALGLTAGEFEKAGQSVQNGAPVVIFERSVYVPALHDRHVVRAVAG